jgi:ribosomal protein S18 acetylase RimI-like enzyme
MKAEFSLTVDPRRDLVRIRMAGFFTRADVADFLAARHRAHQALTCAPNQHLTLADISEMSIQSHDVVDAFREILAAPEYRSRRLAFVVGYTLVRSQAIRAVASREAGWFADPEAAETWLFVDRAEGPLRRAVG